MSLGIVKDLFRVSVALGVCVVLFGVLSVRLAKRDKHISGMRALGLVSVPILIQIAREFVSNSFRTRRDVPVSRVNYTVASGKLLQFQLARPVNI